MSEAIDLTSVMAALRDGLSVCVSAASSPGRFGATVHNAGYRSAQLRWLYVPLMVPAGKISDLISQVRLLGLRGCSVSMPHKVVVLDLLDEVDPVARRIGAVNTIKNEHGRLIGYNTDWLGAKAALRTFPCIASALVLGAGGAARAVSEALSEMGTREITFCARNPTQAEMLADLFKGHFVSWRDRESVTADVLVNCTPVGMAPNSDQIPVHDLTPWSAIMDVVVGPPASRLVQTSRAAGKPTADGMMMTMGQATAQFEIYTGLPAPVVAMEEAAHRLWLP